MRSGIKGHRCGPLESGQWGGSVELGLLEREGRCGPALRSSPSLWCNPIHPKIITDSWSTNHVSQERWASLVWSETLVSYPDSIVPWLSLRCEWLDSKSVANRPMAQTVAALDFVCYDPHLHWRNKSYSQDEEMLYLCAQFKKKRQLSIDIMVLTWSRGPTETLRTLLEMCSQEEPWG